jgi:hypothetical protein
MHTFKSRPYTHNNSPLYKMGPNGVLCQCLTSGEAQWILVNLQEKHVKGHYGANTIVKKLLTMGY